MRLKQLLSDFEKRYRNARYMHGDGWVLAEHANMHAMLNTANAALHREERQFFVQYYKPGLAAACAIYLPRTNERLHEFAAHLRELGVNVVRVWPR